MKLPTLYHKLKTGAIHEWTVETRNGLITTTHGIQGGKLQRTERPALPKNVGRSNQTSASEQAELEAQSMWKHQVDRKYAESVVEANEIKRLPMLAHPLKWKKIDLSTGWSLQPKLDGVRALAQWEGDKVVLTSRSGLPWTATQHINYALSQFLPPGMVVDGELYLHGKEFDWINSKTKKFYIGETTELEYHIFDVPLLSDNDIGQTWHHRLSSLRAFRDIIPFNSKVKTVATVSAILTQEEAISYYDSFLELGYEGMMLRDPWGEYEWGYRSHGILKLKAFDTAEFKVVDFETGIGTYSDCIKWICEGKNGQRFAVNPKATVAEKQELLRIAQRDFWQFKGKLLTVRFQGATAKNGVPRIGVGLGFRDERDL